jgi:predicted TIM-barrel fold metal-dependent hydrolase
MSAAITIDCDVHAEVPSYEALLPYLDDHWREWLETTAFKGPEDSPYPPGANPARSLDDVRRDVLGRAERALLVCTYAAESIHNPYAARAMAAAVNDWLLAEWLEPEPLLAGSVVVAAAQPELAAEEIDRVGGRPEFVQVLLPVRSGLPYGTRHYAPVFDAAARHGLAVCLHFGGAPGNPPTGSGWPSHYLEEVAGMPVVLQSQLMSMIVEGVFAERPDLRVVAAECGFAWLPPFLWRLDKEWRGLRREIPWVDRLPSELVAEHVRLTVVPADVPADRVEAVLDRLPGDVLLGASDYPHDHEALPAGFDPARLDAAAQETYRWR